MTTKSQTPKIKSLPGLKNLYFIESDPLTAHAKFEKKGLSLLTPSDVAYYRLLAGSTHPFSNVGCTTSAKLLHYGTSSKIRRALFKTRPSLVSLTGFQADSNGAIDYSKYREMADQDLKKNPLLRNILVVPENKDFIIPFDEVKQIIPSKLRGSIFQPIEDYLKNPKDHFVMEHFFEYSRIDHPREHYQRILDLTWHYAHDDDWMKKQTPATQFLVGLLKENAVAYAFLNEYKFRPRNYQAVRGNIEFQLYVPEGGYDKPIMEEIRIQGLNGDSTINLRADWARALMGTPYFAIKK
jgi:hypothetical protein